MEINIVKVFLDRANKWFECDAHDLVLKKGDKVVVESQKGLELGSVVSMPTKSEFKPQQQLLSVVRFSNEADVLKVKENLEREKEIKKTTKELIKKHKLEMKVVSVQLSLDESKIIISFIAEERVDFRELVKDLANSFKTRIELRQIGARDEVKIVGALAPCGRVCCCSGYFNDFCHVSIKMAKVQGLSLNPANISGMCGRLMCCLSYENEYYSETASLMPKLNTEVETPDGKGTAVYNSLLDRKVDVKLKNENVDEIKTYDVEKLKFEKQKINN